MSAHIGGLGTERILEAVLEMIGRMPPPLPGDHLDIGPGHGNLIRRLRDRFDVRSSACDYDDSLLDLPDVDLRVADLNGSGLPFDDCTFDLVTCTEVIEHLEHYRSTLREMYRVLRPGGTLVLSTPNILSLKSRIRYLFIGFHSLFGPLHVRESQLHSLGGHINPVSSFYVGHALMDAGFEEVRFAIDRRQGTSRVWLVFLGLPIKLCAGFSMWREKRHRQTVDEHNEALVRHMNSVDMLLGRTVVIGCKKPAA